MEEEARTEPDTSADIDTKEEHENEQKTIRCVFLVCIRFPQIGP